MSNTEIISSFSKNLFWDVAPDSIDLESNSRYIIQRVLEYGRYSDWNLILSYYGIKTISDTATSLRSLDPKAVSFISAITNIPKEQFRCYILRQSSQRHWNFWESFNYRWSSKTITSQLTEEIKILHIYDDYRKPRSILERLRTYWFRQFWETWKIRTICDGPSWT